MNRNTLSCGILVLLALGVYAQVPENQQGKPLVVLASPNGTADSYYGPWFKEISDFMIDYATLVAGNDNIIIIAPEGEAFDKFSCALPGHVLKGRVEDIWMRDIGSARQKQPVLFKYWPNYIEPESFRTYIRNTYIKLLSDYGVDESKFVQSELILDGGNFVDNGVNTAVLTTRVYDDNVAFGGPKRIFNQLVDETGWEYIAIVDELEGDTTGHSDGMVSFLDTNVLGLGDLEDMTEDYKLSLEDQIPSDVKVVVIPNKYKYETWGPPGAKIKFTSACGTHLNALTTTNYVYVPTFGQDPANSEDGRPYTKDLDNQVLKAIEDNTNKKVIRVPVPNKVCRMGGSVRCLSWQVEGEIADTLVAKAKELKPSTAC